jgi:hypothetical protein
LTSINPTHRIRQERAGWGTRRIGERCHFVAQVVTYREKKKTAIFIGQNPQSKGVSQGHAGLNAHNRRLIRRIVKTKELTPHELEGYVRRSEFFLLAWSTDLRIATRTGLMGRKVAGAKYFILLQIERSRKVAGLDKQIGNRWLRKRKRDAAWLRSLSQRRRAKACGGRPIP